MVLHGPAPAGPAFGVEVVGESNYQDALWEAVGTRTAVDGRRHRTKAALVHERDNAYDKNAVAVHAETRRGYRKVGYLPRQLAADYVSDLKALGAQGFDAGVCDAVIVGGFADPESRGRVASLGIRLHLDQPRAVIPRQGEAPRTYDAYESERRMTVEVRSRHIRSLDGPLRTQVGRGSRAPLFGVDGRDRGR